MTKMVSHTASDRAATLVLVFTVPAAFVLLAAGWHRIFLAGVPNVGELGALAIAAFVALGAIALAKAVASERVRLHGVKLKAAGDHTWVAYLLLLLFLSATGSLSTFLYYGEGTTVVTENIDGCEECMKRLQSDAAPAVQTNVYNELHSNVQRLQSALEFEIRNERNCGDGPEALKIIQSMQQYLPSYRRPSGRVVDCRDTDAIDRLIDQYRQQRDEQLPLTNAYRTDRVAEKTAVREALPGVLERNRAALNSARTLLAKESVHGLSGATKIVEDVSKDLGDFALRVRALSPDAAVDCKLNLRDARVLGTFWQMLEIIRHRIDRASTLGYILVAFALDWMMIMFFARVIRGAPDDGRNDPDEPESPSSPERLWVGSR